MTKTVSLKLKCPHCSKSFMDHEHLLLEKPSIKLNIETLTGRGTIRLCSIYGSYKHVCDIELKDGDIARFYCPDCNKELKSNDHCKGVAQHYQTVDGLNPPAHLGRCFHDRLHGGKCRVGQHAHVCAHL